MRIAVIDPFVDVDALLGINPHLDVRVATDVAAESLGDVQALVTAHRPVTREQLRRAPRLHTVVSASTGLDHLDVSALTAAGVTVAGAGDYCTEEVSDHAVACLLSHLRALPAMIDRVRRGEWPVAAPPATRRVAGTSVGVLGTGSIGRAVTTKCAALGMDVHPFSRFGHDGERDPHVRERLVRLAAQMDALVVCASADYAATPLVDAGVIAAMRPGSTLVNVARASLVDTDALVRGLVDGRLGSAYLDVWPQEPPGWDDPRLTAPNLFLTPHAGWYSPQSVAELWLRVARELAAAVGRKR